MDPNILVEASHAWLYVDKDIYVIIQNGNQINSQARNLHPPIKQSNHNHPPNHKNDKTNPNSTFLGKAERA